MKYKLVKQILQYPDNTKITNDDVNFVIKMIITLMRNGVGHRSIKDMFVIPHDVPLLSIFGITQHSTRNEIERSKDQYRNLCEFNLTDEDKKKIVGSEFLGKTDEDGSRYSLDHMLSVEYGFNNNIPYEQVSHPANCEVMKFEDNLFKNKKSSITYDELIKRINTWDNYNETKRSVVTNYG